MTELERTAARLAVARGEAPADLVLTGGKVVNLFSGQVEEIPVAVHDGLVAGLGDYQGRRELDLKGRYLCPGFIEGHLHIESSLLSPAHLAALTAPHGTSLIIAGSHEIANVMGLEGIQAMIQGSRGLPVEFYFNAPSCVPATGMETAGADLGPAELEQAGRMERVLGLGEVMNFPGAVAGDPRVLAKLAAFAGRPIDGHAPLLGGKALNAYLVAGPQSDHECTRLDEAAEKLARGMWIMIRQGTSAKDLEALHPLVTPVSERRCLLVSDDRHPDDLAQKGHLDHLLRLAVAKGIDPITALRMVSLNPARRFGLAGRGAVAPGYAADLAVVDNLQDFRVSLVFKAGALVARDGALIDPVRGEFSPQARRTMRLPGLSRESFLVPLAGDRVRVIGLEPGQLTTGHLLEPSPRDGDWLASDPARDLARLTVIERHRASGAMGQGVVKGLGLKQGALASSVAHDSHNLVVAGMDPGSMLTAARRVGEMGGGLCVARGEEVLAALPLPLAGLMSDQPAEPVVAGLGELARGAARICEHPQPFMPLSFCALPVIPHLKLTDQGLVDVDAFALVDLFVK